VLSVHVIVNQHANVSKQKTPPVSISLNLQGLLWQIK